MAAGQTLGQAWVELRADVGPFEKDTQAAIKRVLDRAEKDMREGGRDGGEAMAEGTSRGFESSGDRVVDAGSRVGTRTGEALGDSAGRSAGSKGDEVGDEVDRRWRGPLYDAARRLGEAMGTGMKEGFPEGIGSWILKQSDDFQAAIGALGAAAMTSLAGILIPAIAGALASSPALLAIGGAIASTFTDPRVQQGAQDLGATLKEVFNEASAGLVDDVLSSMNMLESAMRAFEDPISEIFDATAPILEDLTRGLIGFTRELLPGIRDAVRALEPLFDALAQQLPYLAESITIMFQNMTDDPAKVEGAIMGLIIILRTLGQVLEWVGSILGFVSKALSGWVHLLDDAFSAMGGFVEPIRSLIDMADEGGVRVGEAGAKMKPIKQYADEAADGVRNLDNSFKDLFNTTLTLDKAEIAMAESLAKVRDTAAAAAGQISLKSEKGRELRSTVLSGVEAAIAMRDATLEETGSVEMANAAYLKQISALAGVLRKAGYTEKQIYDLIGSYDEIPDSVSTSVTAPGLSRTLAQVQELRRELEALGVQQRVAGVTGHGGVTEREGGILQAQKGMIVNSPTVLFGERGTGPANTSREAYIPSSGIGPSRAYGLLSEAASWYGMQVGPAGGSGATGSGEGYVTLIVDGEPLKLAIVKQVQGASTQQAAALTTQRTGF